MPYINDSVFDTGLQYAASIGTVMLICTSEPSTYDSASASQLGDGTASVGAVEDGDTDGRKVVIAALTSADVTADGSASHWALTDGSSILVAAGPLTSTQAVTSGNSFTLTAIDITIRDPA